MNLSWNHKLLAGVVGVNLVLALAVSAGAVPMPGDGTEVHAASVVAVEELATTPARQPGDTVAPPATAAPADATAAAQPEVSPPATAAPTTAIAKPKTTIPPTTKAPARTAPATTAVTAPPTTVPVTVAKVARRTPSAAEVQTVIAELKRQVGGLLLLISPTPAQIAQAGDQACTAFDNGQTFAQVKVTGLSMIPTSVTVTPATADWAVRQAVTLYCPGHASKLV